MSFSAAGLRDMKKKMKEAEEEEDRRTGGRGERSLLLGASVCNTLKPGLKA